ncbi:hypothetical protein GCM10010277_73180 [Streptomyces longisporoflavus]|uniref:FAD-dependent oxidoreductase n=1 Tax=Streptomyces longisporoflavus TaxID=28044 RepID=UPI00167C45EC|nr:FAD-dependent oxidoreductase [Streptomyces longisporoflavus]GGV65815.1 hypothetical protein GCM10010277_73180 [Streptomyces longisporoflavus]
MPTRPSADVVVVGNGVLGLSVAVAVARRAPALRVAVIGPPERPGAASAAAGAMFNCFGEVTQYTARHPAAEAKFAIGRQALDMWPQWLDMLTAAAGPEGDALRASRVEGTFVVLGGRSGRVATRNFKAIRAALAEHDEPHEYVDPTDVEIDGLSPDLAARPFHALYLPREGAVDARRVLSALEAACRRHNITMAPHTVSRLSTGRGKMQGVHLSDGSRIDTGTAVLAAGSQSAALAAPELPPGAMPPLLHGTGLALVVEPPRPRPATSSVPRTGPRRAACTRCPFPRADSSTSVPPTSSPAPRSPGPSSAPARAC